MIPSHRTLIFTEKVPLKSKFNNVLPSIDIDNTLYIMWIMFYTITNPVCAISFHFSMTMMHSTSTVWVLDTHDKIQWHKYILEYCPHKVRWCMCFRHHSEKKTPKISFEVTVREI